MKSMNPTTSAVELTERDMALLRGLFEARVMTLQHAAVFHFNGSVEAATKRVQKLKAADIVAERPRRVYEPSVLFLTKKAFQLLSERGVLAGYPKIGWSNIEKRARVSPFTLRHELDVLDVRAAFWKALSSSDVFEITEFSTWPLLSQFRSAPRPGARDTLCRPDGFIRIGEREADGSRSEHSLFLEVDRSTEPQATLAAKAACYGSFYRNGGFAVRNGAPRSAVREFPFRVLFTCRNAERRNNAIERMLCNRPPTLTQVWLTTMDELIADPMGAIWVQPIDYRTALEGTEFDLADRGDEELRPVYRRRPEREAIVEARLNKRALLRE